MAKNAARRWQNGIGKKPVPPNLFGPYDKTGFLATLALNGPRLAVDLCEHYGEDLVKGRSVDRSGLVSRWRSGERAIMVGLNEKHPLIRKLMPLLRSVAREYPVPVLQNRKSTFLEVGTAPKVVVDLDFTFGSRVRTNTLLAICVLGQKATLTQLSYSVPGEFCKAVKTAVKHFVSEGILEVRDSKVLFAETDWRRELLAFLASVARLPKRSEAIRAAFLLAKKRSPRPTKFGILGLDHTQRVLTLLAQNGPMRYAQLFAEVKSQSEQTLASFVEMGLVVDQRIGRARIISLNRRHPIHRELRRFLIAMGGEPRKERAVDLSEEVPFGIDVLFGRRLRTAALLALDAADDGLDVSMLHRILPEHDRLSLRLCLRRFKAIGLLGSRRANGTVRYDFNQEWPYYGALRGLLSPINNRWPKLAAHAVQVADELAPDRRRTKR